MKEDKEAQFMNLMARVQACQKCPRMKHSAHVLGPGCGPLNARAVFVGEAPGRLGADGSHLPFHGDKSGHNFESLIEQVGISRYEVFVTNSVLCNPKDATGNNATPTSKEISNCSSFLKEQLELINPKIAVTLGAAALKACAFIEGHSLELKSSVRTKNKWFNRFLVPAYHPGQRAMMHRSFANQLADYQFISELIKRANNKKVPLKKTSYSSTKKDDIKLAGIARRILDKKPMGLSYFALHKLYFLAEVARLEETGKRLTNTYVIRQKDGPYCTGLHLTKLRNMIPDLVVYHAGGQLKVRLMSQRSLYDDVNERSILSGDEVKVINETVQRYESCTDAELKHLSYLSNPMRNILRKEKQYGMNLFNTAVLPYTKDG